MRRDLAARLLGATRHFEMLKRQRIEPHDDCARHELHHDLLRASRRIQEARDVALQCDHLTADEFYALTVPEARR